MSRIFFYDPLYDFVTFEEAERERQRDAFDAGFSTAPVVSSSKSLKPFLATPEFNRLSFLRQSDLGFLVYPSATHTRFAHAIGCCYLGYIAAREILIGIRPSGSRGGAAASKEKPEVEESRRLYLSKWLEERGWKEEFLLALLLHDVGHFAFSHALENNKDFWETLGTEIRHEEVARQFIFGEGEMVEAFRKRSRALSGYNFISDVIRDAPDLDAEIIAYLICGDSNVIAKKSPTVKASLRVLHELTSGLLDLDRIDHYRRDSYFSGMKFASNLNFSSLLNGFSIWYSEATEEDQEASEHEVRLSRESIGHALTLLHAKERLIHDCFEHVDNLAYEVMLHHAFNYLVFGDRFYRNGGEAQDDIEALKKKALELLMSTDEELLIQMENAGGRAQEISHRIKNRRPYKCIGRRVVGRRGHTTMKGIRQALSRLSDVSQDDFVVRLGKHFGAARDRRPIEWLHLDSLNDENGYPLSEHEEYREQIKHFKRVQEANGNILWLFTPSEESDVHARLLSALEQFSKRPQ